MRHVLLACLLPVAAQAGGHLSPAWERFDRPAYDFVIEVPDHLFDIRRKDADSVTWERRDGSVTLEVSSFFGGTEARPEDILGLRQDGLPNRRVTYEASGNGWAVVSGYEDAGRTRIFYERFEAGPSGLWAGFVMRWDATERADVDKTIKRLGDSLSVTR